MIAKNTIIKIGNGAGSEVFTQIPHVTELNIDDTTWDTEETTSHDNSVPARTYNKTVYSNGNITFTLNPFDAANAQHAAVKAAADSPDGVNFQLVHVDGDSVQFQGLVLSAPKNTPVDGNLTMSVTVMVNGAFTEL